MDELNKQISEGQMRYIEEIKKTNKLVKVAQIGILIAFIVLWEICAYAKIVDPFIFSSPSRVLKSIIGMLENGEIFVHTGVTLYETMIGFVLGSVLGIIVAIILWQNKTLYKIFETYLVVLNGLPKTALAPILIVWIGNNMKSIIVISISLTIIVTIINIITSFNDIEDEKIKLIYSLGGTKQDILKKLIVPSSITTIMSVLKVNIGLALVGVIIGEILVAKSGLGYLIVYGSQTFKMDWVMMSILILSALAGLLYKAIVELEKRLVHWKE